MWNESDLLPGLTVTNGPWQGVSFRLRAGTWLIGRHEDADFMLEDPKVSRRHARVELVDGRVLVTDLGSTNGTWLNEQRITEATELHDGDRIRLGQVRLRYFDPSTATTDPVGSLALRSLRAVLDDSAGTRPDLVGGGEAGAGAPGGLRGVPDDSPSGALAAPTQPMETAGRAGGTRMVILLGGCAALAGFVAAAYQIFG
ncbi:FHA domain-containing protein [Plantactinospora sp. GCM10030261]|uniref:FHA domain-containing protein n=1 Tax=Plantactinospora sp. GCM10030261 TaxID=3273420 RepID=UPI003611CD1E